MAIETMENPMRKLGEWAALAFDLLRKAHDDGGGGYQMVTI